MDRPELADFLRKRRQALQPEDVGLFRGPRRRTSGLRREEVAELCGMSTDYYARLERGNGPQPSEQMAAALARGLRLSLAERDHLFLLTGHNAPQRTLRSDHVSPGLMRVLDRLEDTPAQIMSGLGETLVQTRLARALLGDQTQFTGLARSVVYRWFTDPASRLIYPEEDHPAHGRIYTAQLRRVVTQQGPKSPAAALANTLLGQSAEFAALWSDHEIGIEYTGQKRLRHPEAGLMDLHCQTLLDPDQVQSLLAFTSTTIGDRNPAAHSPKYHHAVIARRIALPGLSPSRRRIKHRQPHLRIREPPSVEVDKTAGHSYGSSTPSRSPPISPQPLCKAKPGGLDGQRDDDREGAAAREVTGSW